MAQRLQRHVQGTQSSSFCLDNIECQGKPVRNNAGEVSTQGLGSHVKEFELFPPTSSLQLSDSAQRVKLGCVTRIDPTTSSGASCWTGLVRSNLNSTDAQVLENAQARGLPGSSDGCSEEG